ncbi:MAG: PilZ domain-containing protein [Gemmatimonadetes bacterium]|nr:PilZ domain-containing protein [Gemmatimonadota bacterium]
MSATRLNPRREFIRHAAEVPIEVRTVPGRAPRSRPGVNVSFGGLAFRSDEYVEPGSIIDIRIPEVKPPFEAHARVSWCSPEEGGYCVGARFLDSSAAFRSRMVEQVCSIEAYRREVEEREGRTLAPEEAALEWIERYGSRFPDA